MVTFSTCCWVRKLGSSLTYEYPWQCPGRGLNQARCHSEPALSLQVPVSHLDLARQLPRELAGCHFVWSVIAWRPFSSGAGEDMTPCWPRLASWPQASHCATLSLLSLSWKAEIISAVSTSWGCREDRESVCGCARHGTGAGPQVAHLTKPCLTWSLIHPYPGVQ